MGKWSLSRRPGDSTAVERSTEARLAGAPHGPSAQPCSVWSAYRGFLLDLKKQDRRSKALVRAAGAESEVAEKPEAERAASSLDTNRPCCIITLCAVASPSGLPLLRCCDLSEEQYYLRLWSPLHNLQEMLVSFHCKVNYIF